MYASLTGWDRVVGEEEKARVARDQNRNRHNIIDGVVSISFSKQTNARIQRTPYNREH